MVRLPCICPLSRLSGATPTRLIQQLQDWSDQELEELTEMIQGLLESRKAESEEENQETSEDGSPLGRHGGRGHLELKMIPDSKTGKTYGPYRYLRYWGQIDLNLVSRTVDLGLEFSKHQQYRD